MTSQQEHRLRINTFEEFLACVLLKKGFMLDRSAKIIEHDIEDWLDLIFRVSRIVSKSCILNQSASSSLLLKELTR